MIGDSMQILETIFLKKSSKLSMYFMTMFAALFVFSSSLYSQPLTYQYTATAGTYTPLTESNQFTTWTGTADDGYTNATDIGFSFVYAGNAFTQFQVSTNGFLRFGSGLTSATASNALAGTLRNIIAPLWDDHKVDATTSITYKLTGTEPNRVLTVEWKDVYWNYNAAAPNANFQVNLYETTNKIEFIYGTFGTPNVATASIGLSDGTAISTAGRSVGTFLSIVVAGDVANRIYQQSMGYELTGGTVAPDANTVFSFTPMTPAPIATGTYTIGGTSPTYAYPSQAATALNMNGIAGPVVLEIRDGTYDDIFHLINVAGTSSTNTITVKNATGATVTFSPKFGRASTTAPSAILGDAMIRLEGTQYTTIDGLRFVENDANTTTTQKFNMGVILCNSVVTTAGGSVYSGSRFNTLKNLYMNLKSDQLPVNAGAIGIRFGTAGTATTDTNFANSYNTIQDVTIEGFWRAAIFMYGFTGNVNPDRGNRITAVTGRNALRNVNITSGSSSDIRVIEMNAQRDVTIEKTDIYDVSSTVHTTNGIWGIRLNPANSSIDYVSGTVVINDVNIYNLENSGAGTTTGWACGIEANRMDDGSSLSIAKTKIYDIYTNCNSTGRAIGIYANLAAGTGFSTTANIYNNYIYDIRAPRSTASTTTTGSGVMGLNLQAVAGGTLNTFKVYYNTVLIDNAVPPSVASHYSTNLFMANFGTASLDLRNNIFVNLMSAGTAETGRAQNIFASANSNLLRLAPETDYNAYNTGIASANRPTAYDGATAFATLADYQAAVATGGLGGPREVNSISENPTFVANTAPYNLHINSSVPTFLEAGGTPITGITTDYDGDVRNATTPDIGADEFNGVRPTGPVFAISPDVKDYGQVRVGLSSSQVFAVTNTGVGTLIINSSALIGTDVTQFALIDTNTYPKSLGANESLSLTVTFSPTSVGLKTATLQVSDNLTEVLHEVNLSGTGFDPTITAFPYAEGFENTLFPPQGWENVQITGTGLFERTTAGTNPTTVPYSGVGMAQFRCYSFSSGTTAILVTPPINVPANNYRVKFWMNRDGGYLTNGDRISVFFNNQPDLTGADSLGNVFRSINLEPVVATPGWYQYTFNFPANSMGNGKHIILKGVSAFGNNIFIDSLVIEQIPEFAVDWCNLQWPPNHTMTVGDTLTVYSQAWINGVTNLTGATPGLDAWIGISSTNTNPATWSTWVPAVFNADVGNNDEFMAQVGFNLPAGTYYYASRWQYLAGPFKYGGLNNGFWDSTAHPSGVLTVNPITVTNYPFIQGFEETVFPPLGWSVENLNGGTTWTRATGKPRTGVGHAQYSYSTTLPGDDYLFTPAMTFQQGKTYAITYWYAVQSASYAENLKITLGSTQNAAGVDTILADHPNLINTTYQSNTVYFSPASTGLFFIGFHAYSLPDKWNIVVDDIEINVVPDIDYALTGVMQVDRIPTPFNLNPDEPTFSKNVPIETLIDDKSFSGTPASNMNNSKLIFDPNSDYGLKTFTNSNPFEGIEGFTAVNMRALVKNQGVQNIPYQFGFNFNGVAGTPINRPGVPFATTDTIDFAATPTALGTFTTLGYVTAANDSFNHNDTLRNFKTLVYPDPMLRIKYDNGQHTPNTFIGYGANNLPLTAGVRFTASENIKLTNVDAFFRNETSPDSILVRVWAAGADTSAPGTMLFSKTFAGVNYINLGTGGDYVTLPLGGDAPIFMAGSDFWVSISFVSTIQYPMGAHNSPLTTPGRSYISGNDGATWAQLIVTTERAWLLRVVGTSYVPPLFTTVWQRSQATSSLPSWFGTHTERGLAFGSTSPTDVNPRVFVASRNAGSFVKILDANTGADVGDLNTAGIAGGTYALNDVEVSSDGKIFVTNLTLNASTDTFRVYMWNNEAAAPVTVIKWIGADAVRLGDKFTVVGDYSAGSAVLYAGSATASQYKVYKWTMTGGAFNQAPQTIALSGITAGTPSSASLSPLPNGDFYWKATGFGLHKYHADGTLLGIVPTTTVASGANAVRYIGGIGNNEYVAVYQYGTTTENARILEIPNDNIPGATTYFMTPQLGNATNTNGAGDVSYRFYPDLKVDIFVLGTNNGLGCYRTTGSIPVELLSLSATADGNDVIIKWSTATEANSQEFQVERKNVDQDNWSFVGKVNSAGTSTDIKSYSFTDRNLNSGKYSYRLRMIDLDGTFNYSSEIEVEVGVPQLFNLSQNYPNPFNPSTTVKFALPFESKVTVQVFAVTGELVETIYNGQLGVGYHQFDWNASRFATGMYIYRMSAQSLVNDKTFNSVKKMMLLK